MLDAMSTRDVLVEREPKRAVRALEREAPDLVSRLETVVNEAVHGRPVAIREYVRLWRALLQRLLQVTRSAQPDLVAVVGDRLFVADIKGRPATLTTELIDQVALYAPFSPWVSKYGPGRGVALCLLSELRRGLRGSEALLPDGILEFPFSEVDSQEFRRFASLVWHELLSSDLLESISSSLQLSDTDLGELFGVRRQAIGQWRDKGIPEERLARVHTVQRIVDILRRNLKLERIPAVVRKPAQAYGRRSIIDAIKRGDEDRVLKELERTFDWATTA